MDRERFEKAKEKWGKYSSWAIWSPADPHKGTKSNMSDMSVLNPDLNPNLLQSLKPNVILLALNAADRDVEPVSWGNFHDSYIHAQDYKTRLALWNTPLWGAYMTDLFVGLHNTDSGKVRSWAKNNPDEVTRHIARLEEELSDIGAQQPVIIALGSVVYDIAQSVLGYKYIVEKMPHYSASTSTPDVLRQHAVAIAKKHNL